ncbi:MAG: phage tail protein, partial [Pseudomonas sp.]|nr:phage tail protein [Pseudomonas sp.]
MPWYKSGTVSVVQNSNAVIGTGTSFLSNGRVGDAFRAPDGGWYEITNIASNTAMSIAPNYQGATNAAGVYAIAPMQGYVKDSADALRALV